MANRLYSSPDESWGSGQGGNQLPGFPFSAAVVLRLFGDIGWLPIVQATICTAAAIWLAYCASVLVGKWGGLVVGAVALLSPIAVPWVRYLLTDALSIAAAQWVFGEMLLALRYRRMATFRLALALAAAVFLRWDNLFLLIPIIGVAWHVGARHQLAMILCLAVLPIGVWGVRSVGAGLPPSPQRAGCRTVR